MTTVVALGLLPKLLLVLVVVTLAKGVKFSRCELARELLHQEMEKSLLPTWVCLVENESSRNTSALGGPNKNGSYDYGLFQINDGYWCKPKEVGGDCNINCDKLLDDDITDDVICAKKIYKRQGFKAWHGWTKRCKNSTLPDVSHCFDEPENNISVISL